MLRRLAFVAVLLWVAPVSAGEWDDCQQWRQADKAIIGCTRVIDAALAGKATLSRAHVYRGMAYAQKGESQKAFAEYETALQLDPKNGGAYFQRALLKSNLADIDGAIPDYDKVLELNPSDASAYRNRGILYYRKREYARALADHEKSISLGNTTSQAYHSRGLTYEALGKRDLAIADYRRALAAPDHPDVAGSGREAAARALTRLGVQTSAETKSDSVTGSTPPPSPVVQGKRVALVVGNSAYQFTEPLPNPQHDARAVAAALRRLGFDVIEVLDADVEKLAGRVRDFSRALKGATVGLFYYAGHGLQVNGVNYLVPVDAKLAEEADATYETVEINDVLKHMERQAKMNVVILDACRNNPLARDLARSMGTRSASIGQGLAEIRSGVGTLIAFATQPGNVALDGTGEHSPFTAALLRHLEVPGLDFTDVLRRVRKDVLEETKGKQVPWDHSSLTSALVLTATVK
jgi:tetratricopeptide (TPR) repeat protein